MTFRIVCNEKFVNLFYIQFDGFFLVVDLMNTGVKVVLALLWINNAMGLKSVRMDPMRNIVQPKHFNVMKEQL